MRSADAAFLFLLLLGYAATWHFWSIPGQLFVAPKPGSSPVARAFGDKNHLTRTSRGGISTRTKSSSWHGLSTKAAKTSDSSSLTPLALLASVVVGLAAAARCEPKTRSATGCKAKLLALEDQQGRMDRKKGPQQLPLASHGQKFFSVRNRQFWDYIVFPKTYFQRQWTTKDFSYAAFFLSVHVGALLAPWYFTWKAFACFLILYPVTAMGITLSYHRQLAHRSFRTPKVVEYCLAYCGILAVQSNPINWVSGHRHHHGATDQEDDVHSPKDGFWWSHMGWILDQKGTWMRADKSNATDLSKQWFYRFIQKTYPLHAIVLPIIGLYYCGGMPFVMWGFFARVVWVWHVTWAINSVSHVWGFQDWNTGDISMNNWIMGILAFGEGWHNNHHAFETSCRHGLKWWQIDMTWYMVKLLNFIGLASGLQYPSKSKMERLSFAKVEAQSGGAAATM